MLVHNLKHVVQRSEGVCCIYEVGYLLCGDYCNASSAAAAAAASAVEGGREGGGGGLGRIFVDVDVDVGVVGFVLVGKVGRRTKHVTFYYEYKTRQVVTAKTAAFFWNARLIVRCDPHKYIFLLTYQGGKVGLLDCALVGCPDAIVVARMACEVDWARIVTLELVPSLTCARRFFKRNNSRASFGRRHRKSLARSYTRAGSS